MRRSDIDVRFFSRNFAVPLKRSFSPSFLGMIEIMYGQRNNGEKGRGTLGAVGMNPIIALNFV